jgi:hypothetical protein
LTTIELVKIGGAEVAGKQQGALLRFYFHHEDIALLRATYLCLHRVHRRKVSHGSVSDDIQITVVTDVCASCTF